VIQTPLDAPDEFFHSHWGRQHYGFNTSISETSLTHNIIGAWQHWHKTSLTQDIIDTQQQLYQEMTLHGWRKKRKRSAWMTQQYRPWRQNRKDTVPKCLIGNAAVRQEESSDMEKEIAQSKRNIGRAQTFWCMRRQDNQSGSMLVQHENKNRSGDRSDRNRQQTIQNIQTEQCDVGATQEKERLWQQENARHKIYITSCKKLVRDQGRYGVVGMGHFGDEARTV
jgi:hypothetical protein